MEKYNIIRSKDICAELGYDVTSSIKYGENPAKAAELLKNTYLTQYPLNQITDIYEYIFGEKKIFSSYEEAEKTIDGK